MIHHELGCAYVVDDMGNKTTVETANPCDMVMADEERDMGRTREDEITCAVESVRDWLGWIFEAGPHPVYVLRRLVACTSATAPWLLRGMAASEIRAISPHTSEADALRAVCRSSPKDVRRALSRAFRREGRTWNPSPTIATIEMQLIIEAVMAEDEALIRAKAMETWLARVWDYDANDSAWKARLGEAIKSLFVEARMLTPELIINMSGEEIAALFGQGRAAESARVKRRVNAVLIRHGFRDSTLRFQKSVTACRTYADRAEGNKNRANGAKAASAA